MTYSDKTRILRAARQLSGLEQLELCERAGLSNGTIVKAETGDWSDKTWAKLLEFYKSIGIEIVRRDGGWIIIF